MSDQINETPQEDNVEVIEPQQNEENVLSGAQLDALSDDELDEYISSGKIPDSIQQSTEEEVPSENSNVTEEEVEEPDETNETSEETPKEDDKESDSKTVDEKEKEPEIDYEKAYKELFDTPIKADGTEIKLKNKDELIALVQKGVNFTRKSQELSKKKKIVQSIESAGIKTEDLNQLIDIFKGDKKAIKSFIKDKKIELDDYTEDEEESYTPNNNIVSDKEVELSDVIDEVKSSPYLSKIENVLNNIWDKESVNMVSKDPVLLKGLLVEMSLGRFDDIHADVVKEKLFSNEKLPDIVRYARRAKELEDNIKQKSSSDINESKGKEKVTKKDNTASKKSASPVRNTTKQVKHRITSADLDKMSDEEILKMNF